MQYQQSGQNPFGEGADARPFQPALRARAGGHDEFGHPVRIHRKKQQTLGHYVSTIMQVSLPYHSSLELAGMQWIDLQPCVDAMWAQPRTFDYEMGGEPRRYTPDIGVKLSDGRSFMVEVKPWEHVENEENRRRWHYLAPELKRNGFGLAFLVDRVLQAEPLSDHLRAIQRFKGPVFDQRRIWELQTKLDREDPWTIEEVLPVLAAYDFAEDEFFCLVLNRHLYVNLTKQLSGESHVWIPSRAPRMRIWAEYNAI